MAQVARRRTLARSLRPRLRGPEILWRGAAGHGGAEGAARLRVQRVEAPFWGRVEFFCCFAGGLGFLGQGGVGPFLGVQSKPG